MDGRVCYLAECADAAEIERFLCPASSATPSETLPLQLHAQEIISARPPAALVVQACQFQDSACQDPVQRSVDNSGTGDIIVEVPWQFSGFLEVRGQDTIPMLYNLTQPVVAPQVLPPLLLIPRVLAESSASAANIPIDLSTSGVLIAAVRDCAGAPVEGVRFALDPAGPAPFFLVNGLPSTQATETVYDPTLGVAVGGFLNVPQGLYLLTARLAAEGVVVGRFNVNVRKSSVVQVDFLPPGR